jgi:hypothetical protein
LLSAHPSRGGLMAKKAAKAAKATKAGAKKKTAKKK